MDSNGDKVLEEAVIPSFADVTAGRVDVTVDCVEENAAPRR